MKNHFYVITAFKRLSIINCALLITCFASAQISNLADSILLNDPVISTAHIGVSIYEPATNTYLYNYDAGKYFTPASNTKLFTCYAAMKYLGDSLVGLKYAQTDTGIVIFPTGDPTFLYAGFTKQPVFDFLKKHNRISIHNDLHHIPRIWGSGWAWDDYMESFMITRSNFPMYGNTIKVNWVNKDSIKTIPAFFANNVHILFSMDNGFQLTKEANSNSLYFLNGTEKEKDVYFNCVGNMVIQLLSDTLKNENIVNNYFPFPRVPLNLVHSQPTDSVLKPMMYRSDNFFAEQTLLMVSNEHLGYMSDEDIIDTLLKKDFKDIPQKPRWVDGSGQSRYNLFTPLSFIYILNKMKNEFGLERLKTILPTGGEGTLKRYYLKDSSYIYAKTGSFSNNTSLSGFLITKENKLLIFSILVNNFQTDGMPVRLAIEKFIEAVREKY